jgi:hypothetical protein
MGGVDGAGGAGSLAGHRGHEAQGARLLVFTRELRTVAGPTGRRLVPVDAIGKYRGSASSTR